MCARRSPGIDEGLRFGIPAGSRFDPDQIIRAGGGPALGRRHRGAHGDHHDWHSEQYVGEWIGNDVTRDDERRPIIREMLGHAPFPKDAPIKVLDVGGGHGQLASFLPEASYCLAEPSVNGISGADLPFADRSFDYVVSCHVLEQIPEVQAVISKVERYLQTGGLFVAITPNG
jgi:2-polyprenyl-3-methyl-5-hydroxy-6-metoxy-1,4-benzoquinol methylase